MYRHPALSTAESPRLQPWEGAASETQRGIKAGAEGNNLVRGVNVVLDVIYNEFYDEPKFLEEILRASIDSGIIDPSVSLEEFLRAR